MYHNTHCLGTHERLDTFQALSALNSRCSTTWIEISKKALIHNLTLYRSVINPSVFCIPIIKSNAYGHGLIPIGQLLNEHPAADGVGVVSLREAIELRQAGVSKRIFVLGIIDAPLSSVVDLDLDLVVYDNEVIDELNLYACSRNKRASVHLKVDTGLSRFGFFPDQAYISAHQIHRSDGLFFAGIATHFANSESGNDEFLQLQLNRFSSLVDRLEKDGITIPLKHTSCSAAISAYTKTHYTAVRFGIGLYGLWPSDANKSMTQAQYPSFDLKPVLTWKTTIAQLKLLPAGSYVGYNLTYQVEKDTLIAVLPVGYWDGFDRAFSNNGCVLIKGCIAPIVGVIAMNLCMVDVTHIKDIRLSDEVTLIGDHPVVNATALAERIGSINYEIVTRINPLIKRVVTD